MEKILNPNIVLNQKVATNVDASNHSNPIKMLLSLFIICLLLYHIYDKVESTMIEQDEIFDEVKDNLGLWCETDCSGADLAAAAGVAISNKLHAVCVLPTVIAPIWAWLENTHVKIFGRFYIDGPVDDKFMSDFSSQVSTSFRNGGDGAIVFVRMRDMEQFLSELSCVRDDLFFNKILSIGLDINEIDNDDWENVFRMLQSVRADSLTLFMSHDDGDKSDFVGRVYAMLNANMGEWHGSIGFIAGDDVARVDQVYRLAGQMRFNMSQTMLFWVKKE